MDTREYVYETRGDVILRRERRRYDSETCQKDESHQTRTRPSATRRKRAQDVNVTAYTQVRDPTVPPEMTFVGADFVVGFECSRPSHNNYALETHFIVRYRVRVLRAIIKRLEYAINKYDNAYAR